MKSPHFDVIVFFKTALITVLTFIAPIRGLVLLLGTAVTIDTLFAIYTVMKTKGWGEVKSNKLFNVVVKSFFYMGSLLFAFLIDKYVIDTNTVLGIDLIVSKTIAIFWTYVEVKSIDETSIKLGNRSFYVILKELIKKIKDIKKDINEIKE